MTLYVKPRNTRKNTKNTDYNAFWGACASRGPKPCHSGQKPVLTFFIRDDGIGRIPVIPDKKCQDRFLTRNPLSPQKVL